MIAQFSILRGIFDIVISFNKTRRAFSQETAEIAIHCLVFFVCGGRCLMLPTLLVALSSVKWPHTQNRATYDSFYHALLNWKRPEKKRLLGVHSSVTIFPPNAYSHATAWYCYLSRVLVSMQEYCEIRTCLWAKKLVTKLLLDEGLRRPCDLVNFWTRTKVWRCFSIPPVVFISQHRTLRWIYLFCLISLAERSNLCLVNRQFERFMKSVREKPRADWTVCVPRLLRLDYWYFGSYRRRTR